MTEHGKHGGALLTSHLMICNVSPLIGKVTYESHTCTAVLESKSTPTSTLLVDCYDVGAAFNLYPLPQFSDPQPWTVQLRNCLLSQSHAGSSTERHSKQINS